MRSEHYKFVLPLALIVALAGCAAQTSKESPAVADGQSNSAETGASKLTMDAAPDANADPLVYVWATGYSGFISAPLEVRREAHIACNERGFAVAVMANLAINGDTVEAEFTCRGDAE